MNHWEDYSIMSHDSDGYNYRSSADYFTDMLQFNTYGGLCELAAAGQFGIYWGLTHWTAVWTILFGKEFCKETLFQFHADLSNFDVYLSYEDEFTISLCDDFNNIVHSS